MEILGRVHVTNTPSDSLEGRSGTPVVVVDGREIPFELIKSESFRKNRFIALINIHSNQPFIHLLSSPTQTLVLGSGE
jgi:hypothetical protein